MSQRTSVAPIPSDGWAGRRARLLNRIHARLSTFSRPATAFVSTPEPRTIGSFARGKQLCAGNFMFAGHLVRAPDTSLWRMEMPTWGFEQELHGFAWLDDLAAVGDQPSRRLAQTWLSQWITRYARGRGPGWSPEMTGRRLIRWINHALFLLNGPEDGLAEAYFRSLAQQTNFLSKRWRVASPGLPRFEALTGLIYAGMALEGMEKHVRPAMQAIATECADQIDGEGGIPTRNPEELLEVFTLLNWAAAALSEAGLIAQKEHLAAIERIAPTLRALRHADGGLARFHGGGRGSEGRLDHALASAGVRASQTTGLAMGFARLSAGRTTLIADASRPPPPDVSFNAHASTLAFELTSGRRAVIVNCGSGVSFGDDWRQAGRATQLHSTLGIDGYSSSRLGERRLVRGIERELLVDPPSDVRVQQSAGEGGTSLLLGHNGWEGTHGLTHVRRLDLSTDGRVLTGEDTLAALTGRDKRTLDHYLNRTQLDVVSFSIRFHIHPDAEVALDMGGTAVSIALKSGEVWVFRQRSQGADLAIERSVYLEKGRLKPREARQIVLSGLVADQACQVNWTLAKAQDTPSNIRDLDRDPLYVR